MPVAAVRVALQRAETHTVLKGETDYAGRHEFADLTPGVYQLRAEKEGYYAVSLSHVRAGETESVEVTLNHQQEFTEVVNVVYSPPAIDPQQTSTRENLGSREILTLPYPTTRDIRNALPFLPGVLQDATGQVHVGGSATYQILDQLDGFNINHPVTGLLDLRVSADAIRSIAVQSSRYSAENGKGTGGVLSFTTGMGDDRYRFSATNFIPSLQSSKGTITLHNWTPRATFSGPLRKGRAWFYDAADGEYDSNIVHELPAGADRSPLWRWSNLAKAQVNLTRANLLTASFLLNGFRHQHAGLSRFNPLETTLHLTQTAYLISLKEQSYFSGGLLLEVGFSATQYRTEEQPRGNRPYVMRPEGTSGNFFRTADGRARRLEWVATLTFPLVQWRGRHEFKVGADLDRITYDQFFERQPILFLREDGTLFRQSTFAGNPRFAKHNFEMSGFAQDRWSLSGRWLLEVGVRLDGDRILRRVLVSPRLASSYLLTPDGETKLTMGIGLFYDATNLDFITRPLAGERLDVFYALDGRTPVGPPVETSFHAREETLQEPRALNWSVGLERKLPASIYFSVEFLEKRGGKGFTFVNAEAGAASGQFELRNARRDHYDSVQITLRRTFQGNHMVLASYARSSARSNAVLDFNLDNPIFSPQARGPLPWDTPNRFLTWGWLPLVKGFDFAYALDWRDGYPFSLINQEQQLVGPPNRRRFPAYFSLNLYAERRFRWLGFQWALRAGFNNLTNRQNPTVVDNNVDSPQFLTFGGAQHRVFTARIRFLGRK